MGEVDQALDDRFLVADQPPHALAVFDAIDAMLAFAVVAERRGLDDRRQPDRAEADRELIERLRFGKRGDRITAIGEERFLARALLRDVQRRTTRTDRNDFSRGVGGVGRDVLELERHHVDAAREAANRLDVVVLGADFEVRDLAGRRIDAG